MTEFEVYQQLIAFLTSARWTIVCASPPGGTDNRYHKCILPREDWAGSEKGLRDEVDLIAHDGSVVLLVECKGTLRDSLTVLNTYGESDRAKLLRIARSFTPIHLAELLRRASGVSVPSVPAVALALAVGVVDCAAPADLSVFAFASPAPRLLTVEPLLDRLSPPRPD